MKRILLTTTLLMLTACSAEPAGENGGTGSGGADAGAMPEGGDPKGDVVRLDDVTADGGETAPDVNPDTSPMPAPSDATLYSGTVRSLAGDPVDLAAYRGKVTLVVNVASRCGYTPQYEGLQALHEELGGDDFAILAFPSNDFGKQEPGSAEQIREFCDSNYGVTFAMFEKVATKGDDASPVYDRLAEMTGERPGWNFCKYVVSKDGTQAKFFGSAAAPDSEELRAAIRSMME